MKIIYLHQYFKTPEEGGAIRSYHISTALANAGFEVEIITSHNEKQYLKKQIQGVVVHYLPIHYQNNLGSLARIWAFLKFTRSSYFLAKKIQRQNCSTPLLCYATSTPLTVGWVALRLKRKLNIPFFFEVRDLWPQAPIEMGVIKYNWLKKVLFKFERKIYQQATQIIALSPGIKEAITNKVSSNKTVLVSNMSDNEFFIPQKKEYNQGDTLIKPPFIISYIGTVGPANHLEYLIKVAELAQERGMTQIQFWIVGSGKQLANIQAQSEHLTNITFHPPTNKQAVKGLLEQSDATYTSFLQIPVLTTCSPNKFFDSLAMGKLTIVNTRGWLKELVEENKCGFYANPQNPEEFLTQLTPFLEKEALLYQYQQNARDLALTQFDKHQLCTDIVNLVKDHFIR